MEEDGEPLGLILGVVLGAVCICATAVIIIVVLILRRRKSDGSPEGINMQPLNDLQDIVIQERLGGGHYGDVYRGTWLGTTAVALKKLKADEDFSSFSNEAAILKYSLLLCIVIITCAVTTIVH